jgi:hypothetical protein
MALKYKYTKREEIPAEQAALYVEREGAFVLDVDGATDKAKVEELRTKIEEFRESNVTALRENRELKERFAGIDPEAVKALEAEKARLVEEQRLKEGKFQEVLAEKLKSAETDWSRRIHAPVLAERERVQGERDALDAQLRRLLIDQAVVSEATRRGLRPTAIPDVTARAQATFRLVDGVPQIFEGEQVRTGKDGVSPMTLAEWVDGLVGDAPHLFEANAGGGAVGSTSGGGGNRSVKNPFRKETWNITEQMKLQKSDPVLAARLKAAAN